MLKSTKEFESFGNFIEDSGGNAVRLDHPAEIFGKDDQEQQQWVPNEAFQMAN